MTIASMTISMMKSCLIMNMIIVTTMTMTTWAWILPSSTTTTTTTRLYNIPPPSTKDRVAFQQYSNKQPPPASFFELQQDCIRSTALAIEDGQFLMEVEFPPLPANVLELDDVSAYDVASANLNLAIDFAKGLIAREIILPTSTSTDNGEKKMKTIQNIAIMLPDEDEARIAVERRTGKTDEYIPPTVQIESGVTISSMRRSEESDERYIKVCVCYIQGHGKDEAGERGAVYVDGWCGTSRQLGGYHPYHFVYECLHPLSTS